jgi:hypothetical protein
MDNASILLGGNPNHNDCLKTKKLAAQLQAASY